MKKKHLQPLTPAALYAGVSSDRQDVDLSVSAHLRRLEPTTKVAVHTDMSELSPSESSHHLTYRRVCLSELETHRRGPAGPLLPNARLRTVPEEITYLDKPAPYPDGVWNTLILLHGSGSPSP